MHLDTVSGVVEALLATYTAGLEYYTKWQQRNWRDNHYETSNKGKTYVGSADALSTSLRFSSRKIKETFDSGADILGDGFIIGDGECSWTLLGSCTRPNNSIQNRVARHYRPVSNVSRSVYMLYIKQREQRAVHSSSLR